MNLETAKVKVAKLMALASDPRANENEAESALRQAEALMRKHAIELAELVDATGEKPRYEWTRICVAAGDTKPATQTILWFGMLAVAIAQFTDTAARWAWDKKSGVCIEFRGDAPDVEYAAYLQNYIATVVRHEAASWPGSRREREDFRRQW